MLKRKVVAVLYIMYIIGCCILTIVTSVTLNFQNYIVRRRMTAGSCVFIDNNSTYVLLIKFSRRLSLTRQCVHLPHLLLHLYLVLLHKHLRRKLQTGNLIRLLGNLIASLTLQCAIICNEN
jgi:hypothetical protein